MTRVETLTVVVNLTVGQPMAGGFEKLFAEKFPSVRADIVADHGALMQLADKADVLISFNNAMPPDADALLRNAKRLKWIQSLSAGVDAIVYLPSLRPDVLVTSMRGIYDAPVAETAVMLMLALSRDLPRLVLQQRDRIWEIPRPQPRLLAGKTVGILGVGAIAAALAPRCAALGMTVIGISSAPRNLPGFSKMVAKENLRDAVAGCDYLVLLTPATPATRGIVGREVLGAMKPTSYLINVGRGALIEENALLEALRSGRIAGAALDTFAHEPLPADHPFWNLPNLVVSPHMAGESDHNEADMLAIVERNMRAFLAGDAGRMANVVRGKGKSTS